MMGLKFIKKFMNFDVGNAGHAKRRGRKARILPRRETAAMTDSPSVVSPTRRDTYAMYVMMYGGYYFAFAMFCSLISVYLMDKGLSAARVSLIMSAAYVISVLVQPFIGTLLDRGDKKRITIILLVLCGVTGIAFVLSASFLPMLIFYGVTVALWYAANPYFETTATMSRYSYRSIRIWGTLGWALGTQVAGLLYDGISPDAMYYLFAVMLVLSILGVRDTQEAGENHPKTARTREQALEYRKTVLTNQLLGVYLVIAALFYASANLSFTYLPLFFQQEGLSVTVTSTVLFIAALMELLVIFFSSAYMNRFTSKQLLVAVFASLIVQYAAYAFVPWIAVQIVVTILLKAASTMMFIMINLKVISAIVPPAYQMSALMLVSSLSRSLISAVVQVFGGKVLEALSFQALYAMLFGMAVLGLLVSALTRFPRGENETTF